MVELTATSPLAPSAPAKAAAMGQGKVAPTADRTAKDAPRDTVTLSGNAEKLVNLGRGQELAKDIRNAPVDASFAAKLRSASQDIFRITRLFSETVKSIFQFWR